MTKQGMIRYLKWFDIGNHAPVCVQIGMDVALILILKYMLANKICTSPNLYRHLNTNAKGIIYYTTTIFYAMFISPEQ
jgi:hypothetical protein